MLQGGLRKSQDPHPYLMAFWIRHRIQNKADSVPEFLDFAFQKVFLNIQVLYCCHFMILK